MGAFNVVRADATCPRCGVVSHVAIQFKYGDTWQRQYAIGDRLRWGGNDVGTPGHRRVVADGVVSDGCRACGSEGDWDAYILIQDDRIVAAEPVTGCHDFDAVGATFIVLDP